MSGLWTGRGDQMVWKNVSFPFSF